MKRSCPECNEIVDERGLCFNQNCPNYEGEEPCRQTDISQDASVPHVGDAAPKSNPSGAALEDLQKQFDEEDQANLAAIAHIPDHKLRENLAVAEASLRAVEVVFDKIESMPDGLTSMETLEDRAGKIAVSLAALREDKKRLESALKDLRELAERVYRYRTDMDEQWVMDRIDAAMLGEKDAG